MTLDPCESSEPHSNLSNEFNFGSKGANIRSHDSSVGIATRLRAGRSGFRVRFPVWAGNFSLHHRVQNGSFPGVKWPGREADHSPPFNAEVKV
jgi:hypothetical protein